MASLAVDLGSMNPYDLTAGPFLALYTAGMIACVGLGLWLRRWEKGAQDSGRLGGLDPVHWAYLSGGPTRALDTAVVGLMQAGIVHFADRKKLIVPTEQPAVSPQFLARFELLLRQTTAIADLPTRLRPALDAVAEDLLARGLIWDHTARMRLGLYSGLPMLVLGFCGVIRIGLGSARHHPVGFIVSLTVLSFAGAICFAINAPRAREAGRRAVLAHRQANLRLGRAPRESELLLALALSGAAVLAATPYAAFAKLRGSAGGDGGCGGGGCGGGGCGGGCGG